MSDALIHALVLTQSAPARSLDRDGVGTWQPGQGLLWLHLDATSEKAQHWLTDQTDLPKTVPPALVVEETRPRTNVIGDGALIVLRGVNLNPGAEPEDMTSIRLWVDASRVISTQQRPSLSVTDLVESVKQRPVTSTGELVVRLTDQLTDRIADVVDGLDDRVADLEQSVLRDHDSKMRAELADLRRDAIALRRYLAPQREALGRLQGETLTWLTDMDRLRLREVTDRLIRHVEDIDAVRERAAVVQEELISFLSDQLNQRMYVLSVVAAIFLPLGFLTGLLGVNVGGIPGADSEYGFPAFSAFLVLLVAIQLWWFIKKRWF